MSNKTFVKLVLIIFLFFSLTGTSINLVNADSASTSVTVGNSVPAVTVAPVESVASSNAAGTGDTAGNPTNEGTALEFAATYTDGNADDWKLLICKTAGITGTDCDGGAGDRWCVSASAVSSGSENTCSYTTLDGDSESNAWFAYGCDTSGCTASAEQGSGTSGSPFYVNHDPGFTVYANDAGAGVDPGTTVTWTTTTVDTDTDAVQDIMTLYICKTASFTGGASPTCPGGEWCHDTTPSDDPSCTYDIASVYPDQSHDAYGYVVDNHGLVSSGTAQGNNDAMVVNNTTPTITAGNITMYDTDGSDNMVLTTAEGETLDFYVTFIVTDTNSCVNSSAGDEIASAIVHAYRSGITQAACDTDGEDDNNNCYANAEAGTSGQCVQDVSVDSCSGDTDSTVGWKCEFPLQYHADPTDAGTYVAQNWLVSIMATDDDSSASALTEDSDGLDLNTAMYYDVDNGSSTVAYGTLSPDATSSDQATNVQATGNDDIDVNISSAQANALCSDYPTCAGSTIADSRQHYATTDIAYASMTALSTSVTRLEVNIAKTTVTGTPTNADVHWKMYIPAGQDATAYTGSNTIAGVSGN